MKTSNFIEVEHNRLRKKVKLSDKKSFLPLIWREVEEQLDGNDS